MIGKLIILEGLNGSGKSYFAKELVENGLPNTIILKFPNRSSETGKKLNKFLKKEINLSLNESKQLFIDNIFESKQDIINNLNKGINIICDRYIISTITYQYTEIIKEIYNTNINNNENILTLLNNTKLLPKPDIIFLINGNHIHKRNELLQQRYHDDKNILNILLFNNYITTLTLLKENWKLIDNNNFDKTTENINQMVKNITDININKNIQYYN